VLNFEKYDYLIVGAGFFGAVTAERIASQLGKKVLVIDQRDHIGGNSFSCKDTETNIEIHKYGPHIFHTSNRKIWEYINRFSAFNSYQHKVYSSYRNDLYPIPINLDTINKFYNKCFDSRQAGDFLDRKIQENYTERPSNFEETGVNQYGLDLYNAFIKDYSVKQWGTDLRRLPPATIKRLSIRLNKNNRYFSDRYNRI
jgi:UDP-galactopyranose mutase